MCCRYHLFLFSIFFDLVWIHSAYETTSKDGKSYGTGYGGPSMLLIMVAAVVGGGLRVECLLTFLGQQAMVQPPIKPLHFRKRTRVGYSSVGQALVGGASAWSNH